MHRFILPKEMRNRLKHPLGRLIKGESSKTLKVLKKIIEDLKPTLIITVGDIVSRNISQIPTQVNIRIIDNKVMRKEIDSFNFNVKKTFHVNNQAGTIEIMAWQAVKEAIKTENAIVIVNGEEDLLALVAIIESPDNSLVVYGQPKEGIVAVDVNKDKKSEAQSIINSMVSE